MKQAQRLFLRIWPKVKIAIYYSDNLIFIGGDVDPMIPGKKVMAIFGFCDIR